MTAFDLSPEIIAALRKGAQQHKYDHGHVLVLSGPRFQTGAARLAARAALRVGAGLVTMGATERTLPELAAHLTEIMLVQVETGAALSTLLEAEPRINALCLGPGLRVDRHGRDLVMHGVQSGRAAVLDADALTLIAQDSGLKKVLHEACVLTPHAGEFARLCPDLAKQSADAAVEAAATRLGGVVLLKGARTVLAAPGGPAVAIDSRKMNAAPWLATAGAGDVLAGLIAGLMARGLAPQIAAELGAVLHVKAAMAAGPGLIAGDLPEMLGQVFSDLGV